MKTALDTSAVIAILYDDEHADAAERALRGAYRKGKVVLTPVVATELAADGHFQTDSDLEQFLNDCGIDRDALSTDAQFLAGERFRSYLENRPDGLQCPHCGTTTTVTCPDCGSSLTPRQHVAPDFLIGGHAAADADGLVTFDQGFFEQYFPAVTLRPTS